MKTLFDPRLLLRGLISLSLVLSLGLTGCLTDDKGDEESGPTISVSPADEVVEAGETATFSVTASGSGTVTYQWTRNGTDIAGATSANYSFAASNNDDGAEYKVRVTDDNGTTVSNGAFLRIQARSRNVTLGAQGSVIPSSLDLDAWEDYTASQAPAASALIDLVFAFSTAQDSLAIYSPLVAKNGVAGSQGFDFMQSWTTTNNTSMRIVNVPDWDAVVTASDIRALYDQGSTPNPDGRIFVKAGTTFVARSNSDLYVLLRVNSVIAPSESATGSFTGKAKW